ncbi:MAG: hypothetical protein AB7I50_00615 [Vicinamibacterales bacterium]
MAGGAALTRADLVQQTLAAKGITVERGNLYAHTTCTTPTCDCHTGKKAKPKDADRVRDCCSECFGITPGGGA